MAGVALISVGLLILLNRFVQGDIGAIILLAAGLVFLPGGILAVVATLLLLGGIGLDILTWVGRLWPLVLVAFGGYFLWEVYRRQSHYSGVQKS